MFSIFSGLFPGTIYKKLFCLYRATSKDLRYFSSSSSVSELKIVFLMHCQ